MRKPPTHYTAEEKVAILRRHLVGNEPVSKLSGELGIMPGGVEIRTWGHAGTVLPPALRSGY